MEVADIEIDERPFAHFSDDVARQPRQGIIHGAPVRGELSRSIKNPQRPNAYRRRTRKPVRCDALRLIQQPRLWMNGEQSGYAGGDRDAHIVREPGESGKQRGQRKRGAPLLSEKRIRVDERKHSEQRQENDGERNGSRVRQGKRKGDGDRAPRREKARLQPAPYPFAGDKNDQPVRCGVQRARDVSRIEYGQTRPGQQRRIERSPERIRPSVQLDEGFAPQEIARRLDVDGLVGTKTRPVRNLARQRKPNAEQRGADEERREPVRPPREGA